MPRPRKSHAELPPRVYKRGPSYYYVDPETLKWVQLGKTLADVHRRYSEILEDKKNFATLSHLIDRYIAEVLPTKAPSTQRPQRQQIERLRGVFGHCKPSDIRPFDIGQYLDHRSAKVAANREIALLSHIYRKGMRWGLADQNPCQGVERNKESPDRRYIEDWEFEAVLSSAPKFVGIAMRLAYLTGQRQADVLKMQRSHLQVDGILIKQNKTSAGLLVRWSSDLRSLVEEALTSYKISSLWLVRSENGQRLSSSGFQTAWNRHMNFCLERGFISERFTFRAIRAKARSDGEDKQLLGHSNPDAMARIYQRKPVPVDPVR